MSFVHPSMIGVIRVETVSSVKEARWFEEQIKDDRTRATIRRGRRILSVWAMPRGGAGFDHETAESALEMVVGR